MEDKKLQTTAPRHLDVIEDKEVNNVCVRWCFTEFNSESITLSYDRPSDFVTSQWIGKPRNYIIYRVLMGVILLGWMAGDVGYETSEFYHGQTWRWFVFASNWSFAILTISSFVQAATSIIHEYKTYWIVDPVYPRIMPLVLKIQWILFNISSNSALVVTTGYWAFIAFASDAPLLTSHMSRLKHTVNTIYVIADVMMSATPIRVYHMFYTFFLGSLYIVFNSLYYINNGNLLLRTGVGLGGRTYYFMNWSLPVEAICTCVLGIMMSAASQVVLHGLYQSRLWLYRRMHPGRLDMDSELQNIMMPSSASYNSLEESYGESPQEYKRS